MSPHFEAILRERYDDLVSNAEGSTDYAAELAVEEGIAPEELLGDTEILFFRWHLESEFGVAFANDWLAGKVRW